MVLFNYGSKSYISIFWSVLQSSFCLGILRGQHMEVLKHGKVYEEDLKKRIVKCSCGCEYRFEVSDVFTKASTVFYAADYDPINQEFPREKIIYQVKCPECGENKDVTEYLEAKARL